MFPIIRINVAVAILIQFSLGCNQPQEKANIEIQKNARDSTSIGNLDTTLAGIYQVVLPCPDCESRLHTVMLNTDGTFRLEEEFIGQGLRPSVTKGTWNSNENDLRLVSGNVVLLSYIVQDDSLKIAVPPGGNEDALFFTLQKMPSNKHTAWQEKWQAGADFFGVGTEPFWSVAVDNEKLLTLTFADRKLPVEIKTPKPREMGDSLVYEGKDANGKSLSVTIYANFCNDGMSDFIYEQSVRIRFEGMLLQGCGRFRE